VDTTYGVSWWAPHPGTSRRILISDQLYACVTSVATNLIEAELHHLEFLDYANQASDLLADSVVVEGAGLRIRMPRRRNAAEDALDKMAGLHVVGVARAISAALDCLGGAVIGVLALPSKILWSDLDRARRALASLPRADDSEGRRRQLDAGARLEQLIGEAGPQGWLMWVLGFRNMLVHRGRRLSIAQFVRRVPVLHGPDGRPVPRVRVVQQLPRDAGRSEIEVFLDQESPVLTEDATDTIHGVIRSTHVLIESTAELMLDVWQWRRANPTELVQPREQWPAGPAPQAVTFSGYAEGTFPYEPGLLMSNLVLLQRMRAASLPDPVRQQWRTFD